MCIIHYGDQDNYSKIKEITDNNANKIQTSKEIRERVKRDNYHREQCLMIPNEINKTIHGIHITPCYKKFTMLLAHRKHGLKAPEMEKRVSHGRSSTVDYLMTVLG